MTTWLRKLPEQPNQIAVWRPKGKRLAKFELGEMFSAALLKDGTVIAPTDGIMTVELCAAMVDAWDEYQEEHKKK
jgi:hypothetical protein